jgi:putative transcriptional regulator
LTANKKAMKNRLKELRQLHQWSQADLARELEISRQAVNGFESGKFDPSLDMAFKIANLFDVTIEQVFIYEVKNPMQTLVDRFKKMFGFERFTEKAINAVKFAHNQAIRDLQTQVEPEHLLLGLLADPTTTSARLLRSSGMIIEIETDDHSFEHSGNPKLSNQSQLVMEYALAIVKLNGKKSIGTEHLLWGLIELVEADNSTDIFQRYEIDLESLKELLAEKI